MNNTVKSITCHELNNLLKKGEEIYLLDVRENNEVNFCKIEGSVHIAMNLIPLYLDQIPDEKKIVIYCHHGVRSLNVANYLINNNFDEDEIYNLEGGIDKWAIDIDSNMPRY